MSPREAATVTLAVYRDGWTGRLQLAIEDESGGYRLAGPKFNGSGEKVLERVLDEHDAARIRSYLDQIPALLEARS